MKKSIPVFRLISILIVVLLLIPDWWMLGRMDEIYDGYADNYWEFGNLHYSEGIFNSKRVCFNGIPVARHSIGYSSLFVDLRLNLDHCEPYEEYWMENGGSIFIGISKWSGNDLYAPILWVMISDGHNDIEFLGDGQWKIGETWIDLWKKK